MNHWRVRSDPARESRKDDREMIHFTCDVCKCELDPRHDTSYVIRMEVYPAAVDANGTVDDDRDHLEDIHEVLERYDEFDADGHLPASDNYHTRRFDLCSECCKQFLSQPLGRSVAPQFDFSKG